MHILCSKGLKTIFLLSIQHTAVFLTVLAKRMLSKGAGSLSSHGCQCFPFGTKDITIWFFPDELMQKEGSVKRHLFLFNLML